MSPSRRLEQCWNLFDQARQRVRAERGPSCRILEFGSSLETWEGLARSHETTMVFSQECVSERIAEQIVDVSEDEEIVNAVQFMPQERVNHTREETVDVRAALCMTDCSHMTSKESWKTRDGGRPKRTSAGRLRDRRGRGRLNMLRWSTQTSKYTTYKSFRSETVDVLRVRCVWVNASYPTLMGAIHIRHRQALRQRTPSETPSTELDGKHTR